MCGMKVWWDLFLGVLIGLSCLLTPYYLAFPDLYGNFMVYFDNISNVCFILDLVISFFTSYHDDDYKLVDDLKVSASILFKCLVNCPTLSQGLVFHRFHFQHTF